MEEHIAILMADLSGYTALTETHGPVSAADIIDKYLAIVDACLVGDCNLLERNGDEVMIVSSCADHLLSTALRIIERTSGEENFLQVHGGLHFGSVLKRNNSYFGTTVNLTARIAAKASPGTFWCSREFVDALDNKSLFKLDSKGIHSFKNVKEAKEVAEVMHDHPQDYAIDPICRMQILDRSAAIQHPGEPDLFFCSEICLAIYEENRSAGTSTA